ncbi:MAG: Uma2 family endonuclease [Candidatus Acididesulfobacter diazotrophicus]|jgi:Uma2 family endonuclease|uniref:Uma2 family endonuclease n=1 Tax=Candidatus Acididesulfobacter diazotrophicus TaxID=2597226 RepID=A0A519BLF7_9DELT|nr:MAG: Uma2 family endonuclease [Candidatus Acididesulfobacter diazotrophicus]
MNEKLEQLHFTNDYTVLDYYNLPEGSPYQLIEGDLVMSPSPTTEHQSISRNVEFLILNYVKKNNLGIVFNAPIDVYLDDINAYQPDIIFILNKNKSIIQKKGIKGAPDLVIEILSPSSLYYDTKTKKNVYERIGVKEYIIIDPEEKTIDIFLSKPSDAACSNKFVHSKIDYKDAKTLYIETLGLNIDLSEIFQSDVE